MEAFVPVVIITQGITKYPSVTALQVGILSEILSDSILQNVEVGLTCWWGRRTR